MYLVSVVDPWWGFKTLICTTETREQAIKFKRLYFKYNSSKENLPDIVIEDTKYYMIRNNGKFPFFVYFNEDKTIDIKISANISIREPKRMSENSFEIFVWAKNGEDAVFQAKKIIKEKYNVEV